MKIVAFAVFSFVSVTLAQYRFVLLANDQVPTVSPHKLKANEEKSLWDIIRDIIQHGTEVRRADDAPFHWYKH